MNKLIQFFSTPANAGADQSQYRSTFGALLVVMVILALGALPEIAMAESALPWEGGLCKAGKAFTGPWLGWIAVIAIVVAAVSFGVGESNGPMTSALRIVGGFAVATTATTIVGYFFPGLLTSMTC